MTLLVAWVGVDTHGPTSMYIASDSRISWRDNARFNHARKVFAFSSQPDILGYCGDVLFPSIALNQIVQLADAGLLFGPEYTCKQKFQAIVDKLNHQFREYPEQQSGLAENSLSIIHASRERSDNKKFFAQSISWTLGSGWSGREVELPDQSDLLFVLESGADEFKINYERYRSGPSAGTTRSIFHCFCDTLQSTNNASVGGAPQLVGLYRKPDSVAVNFGIIHRGARYFLGVKIDDLRARTSNVEWRNNNFELCDGESMKKLEGAQTQPDPLRRL